MRLGLNLGYAGSDRSLGLQDVEVAQEAERLGFSSIWVAEAYGSDSVATLAWIGARTERIAIGSAIMQIPARTPAMTGMTAANLSRLTEKRFVLGLGVSGPQVSEGWHGVMFDHPLARTSEYIDIVRTVTSGGKLAFSGEYFQVPVSERTKALRLTGIPPVKDLPVYLAALGPKNLHLAGEKFDGWLATFYSPEHCDDQHEAWRSTFSLREHSEPFAVVATMPVVVGDDIETCADELRPFVALYVGGMGSREQNFYNRRAHRMGHGKAADEVQEHYLSGHRDLAEQSVTVDLIDQVALLGPWQRIAERMTAVAESGVTTLNVALSSGSLEERRSTLRLLAQAAEAAGLES